MVFTRQTHISALQNTVSLKERYLEKSLTINLCNFIPIRSFRGFAFYLQPVL